MFTESQHQAYICLGPREWWTKGQAQRRGQEEQRGTSALLGQPLSQEENKLKRLYRINLITSYD